MTVQPRLDTKTGMPSVWRVRMKSGADGVDHNAARQFAIEAGIVGAGWALNEPSDLGPLPDGSDDLDLYVKLTKAVYPHDESLEGVAG